MDQESRFKPIFVVGSGRSGTTWIGDTLASCAGCIPIFEPLRRGSVNEVPRWARRNGLPGPYLRAEDPHPEWADFLNALLEGWISNAWTRQDWTRVPEFATRLPFLERLGYRLAKLAYLHRRRRATCLIIKEIRANLMLGWLERKLGARIVYLIRHPCAVIGSRMRLGPRWEPDLEETLCQSALMTDFLEPYRSIIGKTASLLRRQTILWCVENLVPISQARSSDWLLYCYEDFLSERDQNLNHLFQQLGLEPTTKTERAKKRVVSSPSPHFNTPKPWHAPLNEAQGEEVLLVCEEFGLRLYGRQTMPLVSIKDLALVPAINWQADSSYSARESPSVVAEDR